MRSGAFAVSDGTFVLTTDWQTLDGHPVGFRESALLGASLLAGKNPALP